MSVTALKKPVLGERATKNILTPIVHHYAAIHHKKYRQQPVNGEMGAITNDMKHVGHSKRYTTQQLLEAFSSGQCVLLSNFEVDVNRSIRFISSSAFAIDVDDDKQVTNPLQVLNDLKDICTGLFYTFSHNKKGNRYRLLFQLDGSITDQGELSALIDCMIMYLKDKGLPVDGAAKSPTAIIRGGIAGYEVNDISTTLQLSEWLPKAKNLAAERLKVLEERRKKRLDQLKDQMDNPVTYEELRAMCEAIGHIPSGSGDDSTRKWLQIVYALKFQVQTGLLEEHQGYELFDLISGGESNEKYWNGIRPYGNVTVGTIVHHAYDAGYKRKHKYGYALREVQETIVTERITVNKHLPVEVAKELLERKERLLIDSPTGSGKTTAFINAFKELANKDYHYYIFAAPTIPLTLQVAQEHNLPGITGGMANLRNDVTRKAIAGQRIFVTTYNKAAELISYLIGDIDYSHDRKRPTYSLVVDEVHKFTSDYSYRFREIDDLEQLREQATSFIGLSGTCEDVLKDDYEKLIQINNRGKKSPCTDYRVFTYDKEDEADSMLIPVIENILEQTKLLVFINSKDRVKRIGDLLRKRGITTRVVTSDTKKNETYKNIIENQHIDDNVQVVLATTVIADGISIKNALNWSCVVVTDKSSPIFNPSTIKQISNRFRNQYRYFALYMLAPKRKEEDDSRFSIEAAYRYTSRMVKSFTNYLNEEYPKEHLDSFTPSIIERKNGIYLKNSEDESEITFNPLFIRHLAMTKKESYFRGYRDAFIKAVGEELGHKVNGIYSVNEAIKTHNKDLSGLLAELAETKEQEKKDSDIRRSSFSEYFTESIYQCFVRDNEEALRHFENDVHRDQYVSVKVNHCLADYETCKKLGENVKRKADRRKYYNDIQALADIAAFDYTDRVTVTERVYKELLKMAGETYLSADFKKITEEKLHRKLKVKKDDVKLALKLFHKFHTRPGGEACTTIQPLSVELIAKVRHEINEDAVKKSVIKYVWQRNAQQQKVLLPAVMEKWSIEPFKEEENFVLTY